MIRSLFAANYQGVTRAKLRLASVTELVGPNGAGKTSLADAIEYVLTGRPPRGGELGELIRHGEDGCEVEIVLDDAERTRLGRKRTAKGKTECYVDDGLVLASTFEDEVHARVGHAETIRSALRSGSILTMDAGNLQRFLVGLTGARFDAQGIAEAIGEEVAAAAARRSLRLPTNLDEFAPLYDRAVAARVEAKRRLDRAQSHLEHCPAPEHDPDDVTLDEVRTSLRKLRAEHRSAVHAEAACAAAAQEPREQVMRSLRERIAELEPLVGESRSPARASADVERELREVRQRASRAESNLDTARRNVEEVRADAEACTDQDRELAGTLHAAESALARAERDLDEARRRVRDATDERERLERRLADTPKGGVCLAACEHCTVANEAKERRATEDEIKAAQKREEERQRLLDVAEREHRYAQEAVEKASEASVRVEGADKLTLATSHIERLEAEAKTAREEEARLVEELDLARQVEREANAVEERRRELARARRQLDELENTPAPQPPEVSSAQLEDRIERCEALEESVRLRDARTHAAEAVEREAKAVKDTDAVAKALGPKGAKARIIAEGVGPFLSAANEALETLALPWRVEIDPDRFGIVVTRHESKLRPEQLSDGHRTRLLYALQYAVARLANIGLIVFDRVELLDNEGRRLLGELVEHCVAESIQVLTLRHGEPPETVPAGVTAYAVVDGTAKRIPNSSTTSAPASANGRAESRGENQWRA